MNSVKQITVIETTIARRGDGNLTPLRGITQYWTTDGLLLAEVDSLAVKITPENVREARGILVDSDHMDNMGLMELLRSLPQ